MLPHLLIFLLGGMAGATIGVIVMCCMIAAGKSDEAAGRD